MGALDSPRGRWDSPRRWAACVAVVAGLGLIYTIHTQQVTLHVPA